MTTAQTSLGSSASDEHPDDQDPPYTNLYVKCFPKDWDERDLDELFGGHGPIVSTKVEVSNFGQKFAFVNFQHPEDARQCVEALHGHDLRSGEEKARGEFEEEVGPDGHPNHLLYVQRMRTKYERAAAARNENAAELFVKNLPEDCNNKELHRIFGEFGNLETATAVKDAQGKCKGFGFIRFSCKDSAAEAVTEISGTILGGKSIEVALADKKEASKAVGKGGGKSQSFGKGSGKDEPSLSPVYNSGYGAGAQGGGRGVQSFGSHSPSSAGMMGEVDGGSPFGTSNQAWLVNNDGWSGQQYQQNAMAGGMYGSGMGLPAMALAFQQQVMAMAQAMAQQQQQNLQQQQILQPGHEKLSASVLAASPPAVQRQMLGEKLYPMVSKYEPTLAGKITGMLLEKDPQELLVLLDSEEQLQRRVGQARMALQMR